MTEIEFKNYVLENGCNINSTTKHFYKIRRSGTVGSDGFSVMQKIDDHAILDKTYIYGICKNLGINQPVEDKYSVNIFRDFWEYWHKLISDTH